MEMFTLQVLTGLTAGEVGLMVLSRAVQRLRMM